MPFGVFAAWDPMSVVGVAEPATALPGAALLQWVDRTAPPVPVIRIPESRRYALRALAALLSEWRPCGVAPEFATEELFVSQGGYDPCLFAEAVERSSGLCWRRAGATGQMVLAAHPAAGAEAASDATARLLAACVERAHVGANPFRFGELPRSLADEKVPWEALTPEQQEAILTACHPLDQADGGVSCLAAPRFEGHQLARCTVHLMPRLAWDFGIVVEVPGDDGGPTFHRLSRFTYALGMGGR